jgi:alkaline phosphatase
MKVGIVSSVSIDHATPAAFYAEVPHRGMYHEIDHQLAESGFDYFAGGGLKDPRGERKLRENPNAETLGDAFEAARDNGYTIVRNREDFLALNKGDGRVLAINPWLQDSGAMPYAMDRRQGVDISLPEFTAKGIELLDNEKGFFMMVEGGKIDWACHANDATAAIRDTLSFDMAVAEAVDFYKEHPDETLIVVTGDHECGGLTLGFAGTKYQSYFDVLGKQKTSFEKFTAEALAEFKETYGEEATFSAVQPLITEHFGLKFQGNPKKDRMVLRDYEVVQLMQAFRRSMQGKKVQAKDQRTYILYGGYDPLTVAVTHVLDNKASLAWTSFQHTGVPVMTAARGVGAEMFNGYYDNTDVALKMMEAMGVQPRVYDLASR